MVFYQISEKARLRRHRTNEAIALAMQSRWEEAIEVNRSIIEIFPDDADAYNRLGKAYTQLGKYEDAMDSYSHAIKIDPANIIAKKNLERLSLLKEKDLKKSGVREVSAHLFIEETGRAVVVHLHHVAPPDILAKMAAGDPVQLRPSGQIMKVESLDGDQIGELDAKLGLRLIKLTEAGNKYVAAIASVTEKQARVMIKEVYQHPSQAGRPSFPARVVDDFRPYVKGSMVKYGREADEEVMDDDYSDESVKEEPSREETTFHEETVAFAETEDTEDELDEEE